MTGISVKEAASELKRTPGAVRRWIRAGAPTVSHSDGQGGRGKGSLVDPDALAAWHAAQHGVVRLGASAPDAFLGKLAVLVSDFLRRDGGGVGDLSARELVGIPARQAAQFLALLYRYAHIREHGVPPEVDELPREVRHMLASVDARE